MGSRIIQQGETMNFDELKSRDIADLRKLAAQYGIRTHHKQKPETIAKLIVEFVANKPTGEQLKHPAEQPQKEPLKINSEDEIRATIARQLEKPGFTADFPGDDTWLFRCRGAEEAGHMSVPLRVIRSKAESVSRGAISPRGIVDNKINPTANSGLVMMV
jgi:hypothetical protein